MPSETMSRPITIAIAALGGQGGGVLTNWIVDVAEHADYLVQATSVAGVAQRTGATIYGVELFPKAQAEAAGREPVFALYPVPGDVDIVIAAELAEAARAVERQFVTPDLTTLIASTHRVYAMTEKVAPGDGRADAPALLDAAKKAAKQLVAFDMDFAAQQTGSVISSVLLGALAGSGALPFARTDYEAAIQRSGKAVKSNLAGFALGYDNASGRISEDEMDSELIAGPDPQSPDARTLVERIEAQVPASCQKMALEGARRCADYQDLDYAALYLDRLESVNVAAGEGNEELVRETARYLALRMCYEDTIRVADLKTRSSRFERFRRDVNAQDDQLVDVVEYLHPRIEELCDTLPASLGRFVQRSERTKALLTPFFGHGRNITTTSVPGFLVFHVLAKFKRWRRGTLRFEIERERIEDWLSRIHDALPADAELALEVVRCSRLIKGYGDTHDRGLRNYAAILDFARSGAGPEHAAKIAKMREAALADETGKQLDNALAGGGLMALETYLNGHHAVVTGGGTGIGAAIARKLRSMGATVTIMGRTEDTLKTMAASLDADYCTVDVTSTESVTDSFARCVERRGAIAILVNNAGAVKTAPFTRTTEAQWQSTLAVNLDGVFRCTQQVLPGMLEQKFGRIINVASTAGLLGYGYVSAYCAAKHGVIGLTRALALETARKGITVNAICPGYTDTAIVSDAVETISATTGRGAEEALASLTSANPQGRLVQPAEVAATAAWLCGPDSDAITGQSIAVAGGEVM